MARGGGLRSEGSTLKHGNMWNVYRQESYPRGKKSKAVWWTDLKSPAIPMQWFCNLCKASHLLRTPSNMAAQCTPGRRMGPTLWRWTRELQFYQGSCQTGSQTQAWRGC